MTVPDYITYVDRDPDVPHDVAVVMVETIKENKPMKPWTLVDIVASKTSHENVRIDVLKPLALGGVLTPDADGNIKIYDEDRLSRLTSPTENDSE